MVGITARSIPHAEVRQQRTNDRRELSGDTIEHSQTPLLMNQDIRRRKDAKMPRGGPKRKPDRGSDLSNRCLLLSPKIRENHDPATVRHSFEQAFHGFHPLIVPYSCEYSVLPFRNKKSSSYSRLKYRRTRLFGTARSSRHPPAPLGAADAMLVHAEVMRDLVPHRVADHGLRFLRIARDRQDRQHENRYLVRENPVVMRAARDLRHSFVEPEEGCIDAEAHGAALGGRWLVLHHDGHIIEAAQKFLRNAVQAIGHQRFEFAARHQGMQPN